MTHILKCRSTFCKRSNRNLKMYTKLTQMLKLTFNRISKNIKKAMTINQKRSKQMPTLSIWQAISHQKTLLWKIGKVYQHNNNRMLPTLILIFRNSSLNPNHRPSAFGHVPNVKYPIGQMTRRPWESARTTRTRQRDVISTSRTKMIS